MITQEELKKALNYDPSTGIFTRKIKSSNQKPGVIVGSKNRGGYLLAMINGKRHSLHRMAWLYFYGRMPVGDIDHINGVRDDNRIINLRECSRSKNCMNKKINSNNVSGVKGVGWHADSGKWRARIMAGYKSVFLGLFDSVEEAEKAIVEARNKMHKDFARHA
mgnify:CR=1 FL=1|nr:MAG TPA: endonuclease [Caudoviricetes sp.]